VNNGIGNTIDESQKNGSGNYRLASFDRLGTETGGSGDCLSDADDSDGNSRSKDLG